MITVNLPGNVRGIHYNLLLPCCILTIKCYARPTTIGSEIICQACNQPMVVGADGQWR